MKTMIFSAILMFAIGVIGAWGESSPMCFGGYDQFGFAKAPIPCPPPPKPPAPICYKTSPTGLLVVTPCN